MGGQLVFPSFEGTIHLTPHDMEELSDEQGHQRTDRYTIWLACDPHPRTAHTILWVAVNKEGELVVV